MNKIKIASGVYLATTPITLSLWHHNQQINYGAVAAGLEFTIPQTTNGFAYYAEYYPEFGDSEPQFERVAEATA